MLFDEDSSSFYGTVVLRAKPLSEDLDDVLLPFFININIRSGCETTNKIKHRDPATSQLRMRIRTDGKSENLVDPDVELRLAPRRFGTLRLVKATAYSKATQVVARMRKRLLEPGCSVSAVGHGSEAAIRDHLRPKRWLCMQPAQMASGSRWMMRSW